MAELTKEQLLEYVKKQKLKIKKLETELTSLKEKPTEVEKPGDTANEKEVLRAEIDALEKRVASKEAEISALSKSMEDLEDEKIQQISLKNAELAEQRELVDSLNTKSISLEEEVASLNIAVFELNTTVSDLQSKLAAAGSHSTTASQRVTALESDMATAKEEANRLSTELAEAKKTLQLSAGDDQVNRKQLDELRAQLAAAMEADNATKAEYASAKTAHIQSQQQLESEVERLRSEVATIVNERRDVTAQLEKLREQADLNASELQQALAANAELQKALEEARTTPMSPVTPTAPASSSVTTENGSGAAKKKGKNNKKKGKGGGGAAGAVTGSTDATEAAEPDDASVGDAPTGSATEIASLEAQLSELTAREADMQEQLQRALTEAEAGRQREASLASELQSVRDQLAQAATEAAEANQTATQKAEETRRTHSELTAQVERLTVELQSARDSAALASDTAAGLLEMQAQLKQREEELSATRKAEQERTIELSRPKHELELWTVKHNEAEQTVAQLRAQVDAATQEAAQAKATVESLSKELSELRQASASSETDRAEVLTKLQADLAAARAEASEAKSAVEQLTKELSELRQAAQSSDSERTAAVAELQAQLDAKVRELQDATTGRAAAEAEVTGLKEAAAQAETLNKKIAAKLKLKLKECTDLTAEVERLREAASHFASTGESTKAAAEQRVQQLESSLAAQKTDFETRFKALNESVIAGEEKVSTLLREKNKLQEDLFAAVHKTESVTKESFTFKTERDLARQQYLDVETKLQALSSSTREKIDALTTKVVELDALNAKVTAQLSAANEALALSSSEVTTLKENATALAAAKEKIKAHATTIDTLKQQLTETKADADAKAEAANDRIKKLKALLLKVNAQSQEKESKLNQFQSMNDRAKKFNIVTRIGVVPPQDPTGPTLDWCLVYEHRATGSGKGGTASEDGKEADSSPQYRWIEARMAHKWVAEGSTLVGSWPQPVQETWASEIATLRARLEAERDEVTAKLEDTTAQFQAYKIRAQTALKRIGTEDRNEKLKAQEAENAEIERLRSVIQDLKEHEAEHAQQSAAKDREITAREEIIGGLRKQVEELENAVQDGEQALKVAERRISSLQKDIETLQEDSRVMKEQYEAVDRDRSNRDRRMQQQRSEEEVAAAKRLLSASAAASAAAESATPAAVPTDPESSTAAAETSEASAQPTSPPISAAPTGLSSPHDPVSAPASQRGPSQSFTYSSPRGRPLAVEAALAADLHQDGTENKLLLFQQADSVLKDSIVVLRQENAQLMVEINELKVDLGLREDQVTALKNTIRELEASLCREKEFNAENRRINADYLVNVLRNFLMSTDPSERAKLVPVLCQLLHLRPDESKIIAEKWAVRGGGLVGWLLPPRPTPSPPASVRYQAHATGMTIDRGADGTSGKSSSGDLTYDPVTGGGIDVNGY